MFTSFCTFRGVYACLSGFFFWQIVIVEMEADEYLEKRALFAVGEHQYSLKLLQSISQMIVESDYHANRLTSLTSISIHRCRFLN